MNIEPLKYLAAIISILIILGIIMWFIDPQLWIPLAMMGTVFFMILSKIDSKRHDQDMFLLESVKGDFELRKQLGKIPENIKNERLLNYYEFFAFCVIENKVNKNDAKSVFKDLILNLESIKGISKYEYLPHLIEMWKNE